MKKQTIQTLLILIGLAGLIYLGLSLGRATQGLNPVTVTPTPTAIPVSQTPSPNPEPQTILDDLRVRQAIAYCTDRGSLIHTVYPWLEDTKPFEMDSFLPSNHPFYAGNDPQFQRYPYDPEKGRALLESAGWRLPAGVSYRVNAKGEELHLTLTTTAADFRKTWAAVFIEQMKTCGLRVDASHFPADQFYSEEGALVQRDFELAALAWIAPADANVRWRYACDGIPSAINEFTGENYAGWCNPIADQAIKQAEENLKREALKDASRVVQLEYARDLPGLPLFQRMDISATAADMQNFISLPTEVYTWNAAEWVIPGKDSIVIGERSEPAGLHPLDDSWVNATVRALINGLDYVQRDYEYQPITLKRFPTLENGGATINESGQLIVTYEFIEGLTWSDGAPVSRADYQLAYTALCDPEAAGEFLYISQRCDQIARVDFIRDNAYTVTYIPGYHDPEYFLPPIGRQPAHRLTEDGRRLGDVPAKYWTWLAEVNNNPIGIGPYVLQSWEYGEQMVFTANPYYFGKPPATPTIIIRFIPQDEIVSYLLRGEIDVADSSSLWIGTSNSALLQAQSDGKVRLYFVPNSIYEQLDFRLTVK
ncbi:MAG: hypothetical protein FD146_2283 [Anaerolineaceae bacterium]|nr:MAG: hypothetical protein FD146_2283 [Anaerolineaceae bacterium]